MNIYIAAPYPLRQEAFALMCKLENRGHRVTSRWIVEDMDLSDVSAQDDLTDIDAADTLLVLHPEEWRDRGTGGRHFEVGYAFARGKAVVLLGQRTNIFHYLSAVRVIDTIEAL